MPHMDLPVFAPLIPAHLDWRNEEPFAPAFNDHYFSQENGLEETRHVFIHGNKLTERIARLSPGATFVLGETGFGTGLNFLACWHEFLKHAPPGARLHFVSAEKHPLIKADLIRALQRWPELSSQAQPLIDTYPALTPGFHRRRFEGGRVTLTLMFGDAQAMFAQLEGCFDAWLLDGFAPARNEGMWHQGVYRELARLSHANTTLATFTAAGFVRRGLEDAGFTMARTPGFGRKREMLIGTASSGKTRERTDTHQRIAIIGAGLAGCTLASALTERGLQVTLFDPDGVASHASGNLAGVVYTSASAHMTAQNRFYQSSYLYSLATLQRHQFPQTPADGVLNGVLQLPKDNRAKDKARQALASGYWPDEILRADDAPGSLRLLTGGFLSPLRWCRHLLAQSSLAPLSCRIVALRRTPEGWQLQDESGATHQFDQVVLCNASGAADLLALPWLKLKSIRGQVSYVRSTEKSQQWSHAICHGGYLTPALNNLHCVGATFDIGDSDTVRRPEDDLRNLQQLARYLPDQWLELGGKRIAVADARIGFRCQSTDFLPLTGSLAETDPALSGVWLNIAHGSRGITGTPLCAELIACQMLGEPLPVDREISEALAPARFLRRKTRAR